MSVRIDLSWRFIPIPYFDHGCLLSLSYVLRRRESRWGWWESESGWGRQHDQEAQEHGRPEQPQHLAPPSPTWCVRELALARGALLPNLGGDEQDLDHDAERRR